jgi:hypothetical protein
MPATASSATGTQGGKQNDPGMLAFDGFQLLEVCRPFKMLDSARSQTPIVMLEEHVGPIASSAGLPSW